MTEKKRETTGKVVYDHLVKNWDSTDGSTAREQVEARSKKYREQLIECVEKHRKIYSDDFYVDVQKKEERLFKGKGHRLYFIGKQVCPSPTNDQDLFKYSLKNDQIEYLWSIPDEKSCAELIENALLVPKDKKDLLNFVIDFKEGRLLELAKKLNGEVKPSPIIIKG